MMKKTGMIICTVGIALALSSCGSTKQATSLSDINGEWNIVELNGVALTPSKESAQPFIAFDTTSGKVSGNSGCNRMMGSFNVNAKAGTIDLGSLGGTRMMCPDMTLEQNVFAALARVKGYRKITDNKVALVSASKHPVVMLEKKGATAQLLALNGKWEITQVGGEAIISTQANQQPFISLDVAEKSVHGNAGCNNMVGSFAVEEGKSNSIAFPKVATTMMACMDMLVEAKVMEALNQVKTFDVLQPGSVGLYDANGTLVLLLTKN
jgi:heat shock protein HslJ